MEKSRDYCRPKNSGNVRRFRVQNRTRVIEGISGKKYCRASKEIHAYEIVKAMNLKEGWTG